MTTAQAVLFALTGPLCMYFFDSFLVFLLAKCIWHLYRFVPLYLLDSNRWRGAGMGATDDGTDGAIRTVRVLVVVPLVVTYNTLCA